MDQGDHRTVTPREFEDDALGGRQFSQAPQGAMAAASGRGAVGHGEGGWAHESLAAKRARNTRSIMRWAVSLSGESGNARA